MKPIPSLFERCLGLTAAFEGHGFSLAQGNFDGAGITWGIIGFTLKHGQIAGIVQTIQAVRPDLVRLAFEEHTPQLLAILSAPLAEQLAFADSVSIGANEGSARRTVAQRLRPVRQASGGARRATAPRP